MKRQLLAQALRWGGRITGAMLVLLIVIFAIGERSFPPILHGPWRDLLQTWGLLAMLVGFLLAWWKDWLGAAVALIGLIAFNAVNLHQSGRLAGGAFPLFAIPVLLLMLSAAVAQARRTQP